MRRLTDRMRGQSRELVVWLRSEKGQNTVEYLMMMAVIVGVILVIGKMFKPQISGVFNQIMGMISGAARSVGG